MATPAVAPTFKSQWLQCYYSHPQKVLKGADKELAELNSKIARQQSMISKQSPEELRKLVDLYGGTRTADNLIESLTSEIAIHKAEVSEIEAFVAQLKKTQAVANVAGVSKENA